LSRIIQTIVTLVLLFSTTAFGQVATTVEPRTVSQVVDFWVTNTEQLLVPAADAMPEARFSFAPSNGEFSGVRTFAEQVKHLAAANYQLAAATLGEEPPAGTDHETAPRRCEDKGAGHGLSQRVVHQPASSSGRVNSAVALHSLDDYASRFSSDFKFRFLISR
jgi:hypothetical protein